MMKTPNRLVLVATPLIAALAAIAVTLVHAADDKSQPDRPAAAKPALTVTVTTPQPATLPISISANGNVMAWQEASIGTEANGLRLTNVKVNVGDVVKRGQVIATFSADTINAELAQSRAALAEAEATLAEAAVNAQRARELQTTGALSAQQINQHLTAERTAQARLEAARAAAKTQQLRLAQTRVLAPDDGVISARSAAVGGVLPAGQELFRMIRGGRLEWRAEIAAPELARLKPGQVASIVPAGGTPIQGKLRIVAPTVDPLTRNGIAYVDLPAGAAARAGMFARGRLDIGESQAVTLPQTALLQRDGFSYVLSVGPESKVQQTKVSIGRRVGDRVEINGGIDTSAKVVAAGGGFLGDGDLVRVVDDGPAAYIGKQARNSNATPAVLK